MQVTTRTTVHLDGTEIRDIIAAHLRSKGTLPKGAKYALKVLIPCEHGSQDKHEIKNADDVRIQVDWPAESSTIVAKVGT